MSNGREKKKQSTEMDEVEQLLQAAHDDVFLKLSLNSHTVSSSSSLNPDLTRRFQSLKSGPSKPQPNPKPDPDPNPNPIPSSAPPTSAPVDEELKTVLGDDLSARFAALKASLYSPSPSSSSSATTDAAATVKSSVSSLAVSSGGDEEEDEVEKLIQWAIDAARLDPSPPSDLDTDQSDDDGVEDEEEDEDEDEDDDDDDDKDSKRKKGNGKNNKKEKSNE